MNEKWYKPRGYWFFNPMSGAEGGILTSALIILPVFFVIIGLMLWSL